jgi:hypothetical protein
VKRFRFPLIVAAVLIVACVSGWFGLHGLVRSDLFRVWLSKKVSQSLHAEGQFAPLSWEGSSFTSSAFSAKGTPRSNLRSLEVTNISAHLDWSQLLHGRWVIDQFTADKVDVVLGKKAAAEQIAAKPKREPKLKLSRFLPSDLVIGQINVPRVDLHWTTGHGVSGQFTGTKVNASRDPSGLWNVETTGGIAEHGSLPSLEVQRVHGTVTEKLITVQEAIARVAGGGDIRLTGHINNLSATEMTADFSDLSTPQLLPKEWQLDAKGSGHLTYTGSIEHIEQGRVTGSIEFKDAKLDLANFLGKLRNAITLGSLGEIHLDSMQTDLQYEARRVQISNFSARYQDQIQIQGNATVDAEHLDGILQIGVAPKMLSWIPGAEEKVFTEDRDGLRWTTMKLTGSPAEPKEDLSKRLREAARDTIEKQFKANPKDAVKSLLDMLHH